MSGSNLEHSMFHRVLYPAADGNCAAADLLLRRLLRFAPPPGLRLEDASIVVFDFESTGLDTENDFIIEIGAEKLVNFEVVAEFSALVKPPVELSEQVMKLTGITPVMLEDKPRIAQVLPEFLDFIKGSLLVAHNADYDFRLMRAEAARLGFDLEWPCFCTLKMARELLPDIENRKLDTIAGHYALTFGSRHRSMGDVRVTSDVLKKFVTEESDDLDTWADLQPFYSL
jgi:DNA polymerase III epsilon subunit family exonuclease